MGTKVFTQDSMVKGNKYSNRKEVNEMERKSIRGRLSLTLGVLVLAVVMFLIQTPTHGAVTCPTLSTGDSDGDGFTDQQECEGLTLMNQTLFPGRQSGLPRANRLDPDTKDLFVILVPASTSKFPENPLEYVSRVLAEGGLAITLHTINDNQATLDRFVSSSSQQKAIKIVESSNTSNLLVLGQAPVGAPNSFNDTFDEATIFTENIITNIAQKCGNRVNTLNCADTTGAYGQLLIDKYIKHTIAHETGHMVILRYLDITRATDFKIYSSIGNHYPDGTLVLLDQFVKTVDKSGKVTFYLGTVYTSPDQTRFRLK